MIQGWVWYEYMLWAVQLYSAIDRYIQLDKGSGPIMRSNKAKFKIAFASSYMYFKALTLEYEEQQGKRTFGI